MKFRWKPVLFFSFILCLKNMDSNVFETNFCDKNNLLFIKPQLRFQKYSVYVMNINRNVYYFEIFHKSFLFLWLSPTLILKKVFIFAKNHILSELRKRFISLNRFNSTSRSLRLINLKQTFVLHHKMWLKIQNLIHSFFLL